MVHTAVERGKALVQVRRHDAVGGLGKVTGYDGELLIVAFHAKQDAPQRDDADATVVVGIGAGEQVVFEVGDGVFHAVQDIDIVAGQGKQEVQHLPERLLLVVNLLRAAQDNGAVEQKDDVAAVAVNVDAGLFLAFIGDVVKREADKTRTRLGTAQMGRLGGRRV